MNNIKQGDIIFIDAEPHSGHEMGGHDVNSGNIRRPLVVLSTDGYNKLTGLVTGMFISTSSKAKLPGIIVPILDVRSGVKGNILTWTLPNFDSTSRRAEVVGKINDKTLRILLKYVKDVYNI